MEHCSSRISDKEYLQEITKFSEECIEIELAEPEFIFAGLATRIGLALGNGVRLQPDEIVAIRQGIENRHLLMLPAPRVSSPALELQ